MAITQTQQQILEGISKYICDFLTRQKKVSKDEFGPFCAYRSGDGRCCAVGALIQDADYNAEKMEESDVTNITVFNAACLGIVKLGLAPSLEALTGEMEMCKAVQSLLMQWQQYHDSQDARFVLDEQLWYCRWIENPSDEFRSPAGFHRKMADVDFQPPMPDIA